MNEDTEEPLTIQDLHDFVHQAQDGYIEMAMIFGGGFMYQAIRIASELMKYKLEEKNT